MISWLQIILHTLLPKPNKEAEWIEREWENE